MLKYKKASVLVILIVAVAAISQIAFAQVQPTPEWVNFYSQNSTFNGQPLPVGAIVSAYDADGVLCGEFTVVDAGEYGLMPCYRDDATTAEDEGATVGDTITFKVSGVDAVTTETFEWTENGALFEADLTVTSATPPVIPEPTTVILFGLSLIALFVYVQRRRQMAI